LRHFDYLRQAVDGHLRMPCLGGILKNEDVAIPERHLGLTTQMDWAFSDDMVNRLADLVEAGVDLDRVISAAGEVDLSSTSEPPPPPTPKRVTIGVAMDNAFCFYYQDNFELLESAGAQLVYFSPIADPGLPDNIDGLYLGGGYPELFAAQLAHNGALRRQIRRLSRNGMPIYGECGGLMYLGERLDDLDGSRFPMTGCFPLATRMLSRLKTLGYREVELADDSPLGPAGLRLRGHEFHYSEIVEIDSHLDRTYRVSRGSGSAAADEGYRANRTLGSYLHLHFGSRPECAHNFVQNCITYRHERNSSP
jgi:cobyrinic acid a,c-diamide synthase